MDVIESARMVASAFIALKCVLVSTRTQNARLSMEHAPVRLDGQAKIVRRYALLESGAPIVPRSVSALVESAIQSLDNAEIVLLDISDLIASSAVHRTSGEAVVLR